MKAAVEIDVQQPSFCRDGPSHDKGKKATGKSGTSALRTCLGEIKIGAWI